MQHVSKKWLLICNFLFALLDTTFIVLFAIRNTFEIPTEVQDQWGISQIVAIVSSVHLTYLILIYPFLNRRFTWLANIISVSLMAMFFSVLIDESGNTNLVYRLGYAGLVFLMGLNGPFAPIATIVLTWLIMIFSYTGLTSGTNASLAYNVAINLTVTVAGLAGWLIFKRFYVNIKTETEIQLTNLLKEEQFKSNVVIESITDGVMIVNDKGTIQMLNESAAQMLGWNKKEALNLDYRSVVIAANEVQGDGSDDNQKTTALELSMNSGKPVQIITKLETRNQREIYVDIVASPIFSTIPATSTTAESQTIVGTIAVLRNVDAQKREEQKRSDFISTASHEMRTPVASIQGFLELALNPKVAAVDEKARTYLTKAHEATRHLGDLFQDLLTVSRSDDGRLVNNPQLIEVGELLYNLVEEHKFSAEKKGLKVSLDGIGPNSKGVNPLQYIHVDPDRLREVIANLFENAVKYTKTGMITVGASQKPQSVIIRISDTGIGIAAEDISHLFQKFYRTDNTETREIGGTGLGLYICKQIVQVMRGKIWVESTLGAGSTFYVEIPRVDPNKVTSASANVEPSLSSNSIPAVTQPTQPIPDPSQVQIQPPVTAQTTPAAQPPPQT